MGGVGIIDAPGSAQRRRSAAKQDEIFPHATRISGGTLLEIVRGMKSEQRRRPSVVLLAAGA
jgi:hypothetical protein